MSIRAYFALAVVGPLSKDQTYVGPSNDPRHNFLSAEYLGSRLTVRGENSLAVHQHQRGSW